jgi:hypothetical protein
MANPPVRRPYERPRLTVYGDLRTVTLNNVTTAMNDPGNGSKSMT